MHACCGGHFEIVEFLLENGADVHVKSTKVMNWHLINVVDIMSYVSCIFRKTGHH